MSKCPKCGYEPPKGRPKKLNDTAVMMHHRSGESLSAIAKRFGVTRGAIQESLRRHERDLKLIRKGYGKCGV
jgi:transposase